MMKPTMRSRSPLLLHLLRTIAMLVAGLSGAAVLALPGELDTTFGSGGRVIDTLGYDIVSVRAMARQPDGKLVVAATCTLNLSQPFFCVARFNANGSLDLPFGNSGRVRISPTNGAGFAIPNAIAIEPTGNLVVGGQCEMPATGADFCMVRIDSFGTLDGGFGLSGWVTTSVSPANADSANAIVLEPGGRIILGGPCDYATVTGVNFCLARYERDGKLDRSFGNNGLTFTSYVASTPGGQSDVLTGLIKLGDGRLLAGGHCDTMTATGVDLCLMRFSADGVLDTSFGTGGKTAFAVGPGNAADHAYAMALQPDGKVLLGGSCYAQAATGFDFCLIRVDPATATLDTTFNGTGKLTLPVGFGALDDVVRSIVVQPDGRIIAAGSCGMGNATTAEDFCWVRLLPEGQQDRAIAGNTDGTGVIATAFGSGASNDRAYAMLLQPDGNLVLAGGCQRNVGGMLESACLARYQGGPFGYTACTPDLDGDGQYHPLIDGLLLTRILLGFNDSRALSGIRLSPGATRNNWNLIASHLARHCGVRGLFWTELSQ